MRTKMKISKQLLETAGIKIVENDSYGFGYDIDGWDNKDLEYLITILSMLGTMHYKIKNTARQSETIEQLLTSLERYASDLMEEVESLKDSLQKKNI